MKHPFQKQFFVVIEGCLNFSAFVWPPQRTSLISYIMDSVLGNLIGNHCLIYLDDIFIFSDNAEEHLGHIQIVFERLRKAGFTLNSEKCHF